MIDRPQRAAMAQSIQRFTAGEIGSFEFDDQLQAIATKSDDESVRLAAFLLWFTYDDITDHKVVADKVKWDFFQRIILLLESDAELEEHRTKTWSWRQAIAASCVIIFGFIIWRTGWGGHLMLFAIPFGLISMGLTMWRYRVSPPAVYDPALFPFNSIPQLASVRRTLPLFHKNPYPSDMRGRRIRSTSEEKVMRIRWRLTWLLWGPIVIFAQAFPEITRRYELRTKASRQAA